jgi:tetratricopeptide (TPR) repeat protein
MSTPGDQRARAEPRLPSEWLAELATTAPHRQEQVAGLVSRGLEAFLAGDYETSARLARQAKDRAPRSARVRELLGLAAYRAGRWKEALGELLAYRRLTGQLDENHLIADCYRAQGRPERALEVCDEVSRDRVPPELWAEVVIVAASALADRGMLAEALARLSRADLEPQQVNPYHLRLWYVQADLLERAGRREEALQIWERISAEEPSFFDTEERLRGS